MKSYTDHSNPAVAYGSNGGSTVHFTEGVFSDINPSTKLPASSVVTYSTNGGYSTVHSTEGVFSDINLSPLVGVTEDLVF
jgi:hypothetical protein